MQLNYEREFDEFKSYIEKLIDVFDRSQMVKRIEIGFQVDQVGLIKVFFDCNPNAKPDGSWTQVLDEGYLERSHWPELCEFHEYDFIVQEVGEIIKSVLFKVREEGAFEALSKHRDCELGIEEIDGNYGWPIYEDRGVENVV